MREKNLLNWPTRRHYLANHLSVYMCDATRPDSPGLIPDAQCAYSVPVEQSGNVMTQLACFVQKKTPSPKRGEWEGEGWRKRLLVIPGNLRARLEIAAAGLTSIRLPWSPRSNSSHSLSRPICARCPPPCRGSATWSGCPFPSATAQSRNGRMAPARRCLRTCSCGCRW